MKLAVFCEGHSEIKMFKSFLYKHCFHMRECKSPLDFSNEVNNAYYLFNSGCDANVLSDIKKMQYLTTNSLVIAVRDSEDSCFTSLKLEAEKKKINNQSLKFLFAKPEFESIYQHDIPLFKKVFEKQLKKSKKTSEDIDEKISMYFKSSSRPESGLKQLCAAYIIAYDKPQFAEDYFSQLDFMKAKCAYVERLVSLLNPFVIKHQFDN